MSDEDFLLSSQNVRDYLAEQGFLRGEEDLSVCALGGGVSNVVLLVEWPGNPEKRWVVKQSLGKLRVKDDWRSERSRIFREAESIRALRPVLGSAALPEVIHVDSKRFLYIMTAAPVGSQVWKDLLLARRADSASSAQRGLASGEDDQRLEGRCLSDLGILGPHGVRSAPHRSLLSHDGLPPSRIAPGV